MYDNDNANDNRLHKRVKVLETFGTSVPLGRANVIVHVKEDYSPGSGVSSDFLGLPSMSSLAFMNEARFFRVFDERSLMS